MKRTISRVSIGGGQCRITVRFDSEQCESSTADGRRARADLLRVLTDNVDLQLCGFVPFQKLTMQHNGENWIVEMEAVQPE